MLRALFEVPKSEFAAIASQFGYEEKYTIAESEADVQLKSLSTDGTRLQEAKAEMEEPTPDSGGLYRFLVPLEYKRLTPQPIPPVTDFFDIENQIHDEGISRKKGIQLPPSAPLVPWSRLGPFMRKSLGAYRSSDKVDVPKYISRLSRMIVQVDIPRIHWLGWASQAIVLMDFGASTEPFWSDLRLLKKSLHDEGGRNDFQFLTCENRPPPRSTWWQFNPRIPFLVVSDMGCLSGDAGQITAWVEFGVFLKRKGVDAVALLPCPRNRWSARLAQVWRCACWDRGERMPRAGSGSVPKPKNPLRQSEAEEGLLDLLSPAARIEPWLLRRMRLLASRGADIGTEYDVWFSNDTSTRGRVMGFKPDCAGPRRARFLSRADSRAKKASALIRKSHLSCSELIQGEVLIHLEAAGIEVSEKEREGAWALIQQTSNRIAALARDPSSRNRLNLLDWFPSFFRRLSGHTRSENAVVSATWAMVRYYAGDSVVELPDEIDETIANKVLDSLSQSTQSEYRWEIAYDLKSLSLECVGAAAGDRPKGTYPLLNLVSRMPRLDFEVYGSDRAISQYSVLAEAAEPVVLPRESSEFVRLGSDTGESSFRTFTRPDWAERMGYDRSGLYAVLRAGDVSFRMRWIAPGSFLMGSPENEAGRYDNEVPHEVTLTKGYWLAEMQTTQALWQAVMGDRLRGVIENVNKRHPITDVSWHDCLSFCQKLEKTFADAQTGALSLSFTLPTEAQWEYACRAGANTAFNDGSPCTVPVGNDPALDRLAWFGQNSARSLHEVGLKQANAWGLYDMHGNVWEWCGDWYGDLKADAATDPIGADIGRNRVLRGGSFGNFPRICRSASRSNGAPSSRVVNIGFRLAAGQSIVSSSQEVRRSVEPADQERGTSDKEAGAAWSVAKVVGLWDERALAPWPWEVEPELWPEDEPAWAESVWRDEYGVAAEFHINGVAFVFRQVLPGTFMMGSPSEEEGRDDDETQHKVTLTRGYWLAETPTTQAQWQAVLGKNPSVIKGDRHPAEQVNWEDCRDFCAVLNRQLGQLGAALPTEAEWEYACRAGTDTDFNGGKGVVLDDLGWYSENSESKTHPVGEKQPNKWGLQDMHGNVLEWCADWFEDFTDKLQVDPQGASTGQYRVLRGGSFRDFPGSCRSAFRGNVDPSSRGDYFGFRLAAGHFIVSSRRRSESGAGQERQFEKRSVAKPMPERGTSEEAGGATRSGGRP